MYRQGDVLLVRVRSIPQALEPVAREMGRVVLAHGEVTGHAHAIRDAHAAMFRDAKGGAIFMNVSGEAPVALEHDEHDTIDVPPGTYRVIRQREYSPETVRDVAD
ncbi:MAG: hypothetical protein ACLPKB_13865 [Xanthobacteraceae bacterium]